MKGWEVFYRRFKKDGEAIFDYEEDSVRVLGSKGNISKARAIKIAKENFESKYWIPEIGKNPFEMEIIAVERI